jgi:hypothetical protein
VTGDIDQTPNSHAAAVCSSAGDLGPVAPVESPTGYNEAVRVPPRAIAIGALLVAGCGGGSPARSEAAASSGGGLQAAGAGGQRSSAATGPQGCGYLSYEDAQSLADKGAYLRSKGLGGAIIWTINEGYLPAAPSGQRSPLLTALGAAVLP